MRFILLLVMSVAGDVETAQLPFESDNLCAKAKAQIEEAVAKTPGEMKLQGAYCLEAKYN